MAKTTKAPTIDEDDVTAEAGAGEVAEASEEAPQRMQLKVTIDKAGPCKRHVRVVVSRESIEDIASG